MEFRMCRPCIQPAQVVVVNAAFTLSTAELDWARRVQSAFDAGAGGVFTIVHP